MKPYRIRNSKNKRSFRRGTRVHRMNFRPRPSRGGARL